MCRWAWVGPSQGSHMKPQRRGSWVLFLGLYIVSTTISLSLLYSSQYPPHSWPGLPTTGSGSNQLQTGKEANTPSTPPQNRPSCLPLPALSGCPPWSGERRDTVPSSCICPVQFVDSVVCKH